VQHIVLFALCELRCPRGMTWEGGQGPGGSTHAGAALATGRAIVIAQRTDDYVVFVRDGEGSRQRGARRHGQLHLPSDGAERWGGGSGRAQDAAERFNGGGELRQASGSSGLKLCELCEAEAVAVAGERVRGHKASCCLWRIMRKEGHCG
jgi:hypothetical protein